MRTRRTKCESLTCGELARRWGVSGSRIHQLIEAGDLPGVFEIPAAGAFRRIIKIPMSSVLHAEATWSISPVGDLRTPAPDRADHAGEGPEEVAKNGTGDRRAGAAGSSAHLER